MKVRVINKSGHAWDFASMKEARPHIKKNLLDDYSVHEVDGKKIRVYDDRK